MDSLRRNLENHKMTNESNSIIKTYYWKMDAKIILKI